MAKRNLANTNELLAEFFTKVIKYSFGTIVVVLILAAAVLIVWLVGKLLLEAVFDNPILLIPFGLLIIMIIAAVHTHKEYKGQIKKKSLNQLLKAEKNK